MKKRIENVTIEGIVSKYRLPHVGKDIAMMGSLSALPTMIDARRFSLCLFIGVCTSGVCTLAVNDRRRAASSGNVMIITEESVVTDVRFSDDFDGYGFFMSYSLLHDILKDVQNRSDLFLVTHNYPVFDLTRDEMKFAQEYFSLIISRMEVTKHPYRLEVVRLMILTMLYELSVAFERTISVPDKNEKQTRGEQIFVQFIQSVQQNFRRQRQVQWYANELGITPKYLCEVITSVSRRSPNEWISKFVTAEMRNLLRHTDMKMGEIAQELNFPTQSFFGKYFKDNVGVSPSEYRHGLEERTKTL